MGGLPRGASTGPDPSAFSKTRLYLVAGTGVPVSSLLPSRPVPFPLWPYSPWGSWAAPPIVGMGIEKGQWSCWLPSRWGRSSS